jgi:hypothetical protein
MSIALSIGFFMMAIVANIFTPSDHLPFWALLVMSNIWSATSVIISRSNRKDENRE